MNSLIKVIIVLSITLLGIKFYDDSEAQRAQNALNSCFVDGHSPDLGCLERVTPEIGLRTVNVACITDLECERLEFIMNKTDINYSINSN